MIFKHIQKVKKKCKTCVVKYCEMIYSRHGSKSRSRPLTRRALRRISRGDSDQSRAIRAKRYMQNSKNSEKEIVKKIVDIKIHVSHVQNKFVLRR